MGLTWQESLADLLSSLNEQLGRVRKPIDTAADYYSQPENSIDLPVSPVGPPLPLRVPNVVQALRDVISPTQPAQSPVLGNVDSPSVGTAAKDAIFPEDEAKKSYVESIARSVTGLTGDMVSDPTTFALGVGGIPGKVAGAGFTGLAMKGAYDAATRAIEKSKTEGFSPSVAGEATDATLQAGIGALGAKHLLGGGGHEVPTTDTPKVGEDNVVVDEANPPFVQMANKAKDLEEQIKQMPTGPERTKAIEEWWNEKVKQDTVPTVDNQITPKLPPNEGPAEGLAIETPKETFLNTRDKEGLAVNNEPVEPVHVDSSSWEKFSNDPAIKAWAKNQIENYNFSPEEVQNALRESFKHGINPTMSDTLDSLGDHMDSLNIPKAEYAKNRPQPKTPGWKKAEEYVLQQPGWGKFADWYERVSEFNKGKLLGLSKEVLPPTDAVRGGITSLAGTGFMGPHFGPGKYASNWIRKVKGLPGEAPRVESQGHDINILPFMRDLVNDIHKYPNWAEYVGGDKTKLGEELLRRIIHTNVHELAHSLGLEHPLLDTQPHAAAMHGLYNWEAREYSKKFREEKGLPEDQKATGDQRFANVLKAAIDAYKGGELDHLIDEARPHLDEWQRLFTEADQIARRPTEIAPPVLPKLPPPAIPPEGRGKPGEGGGVSPGGVPGGGGTTGRGEEPPTGGSGRPPVVPPEGPPFRPSDGPNKTDWSKLPQHGIKEFINLRRAALTHARATRFQFSDLLDQGMDWVKKFEAGEKVPGGDRVKALFDKMLAEEQRYGVPVKERPNYIYHLWNESPEQVRRTFRRLGIRPSFTNERIYDTYESGIKAGLTPKYDNPVDIIAERMRQHKKLIADKGLYNTLRAGKLIKPVNKAPQDWQIVRNFPFHRYTTGKMEHIQPWSAPPEVAERLNRYLDSPISSPIRDFFQKVAGVSTDVKNVVMSSGIPGTLFNAHGFNTAMRVAAAKGSPWAALGEAAKVPFKLINSGKGAAKYLDANLSEIARFQEAGATFNIEDHPFRIVDGETVPKGKKGFWEQVRDARDAHGNPVSRNYAALRKFHELVFEDPLFQRALPAWKLEFMKGEEARLLEKGVEPKEATRIAAKNGNTLLGGINWEGDAGLKGDPQFRTALRIAFNAPDWAETNLRIAKGALDWLKHPKDPKFQMYKNLVQNTFLLYVVTNAISRGLSKEEYPTERHFQARIGKAASGRSRFIKPAGTGADWVRLPYEIIAKLSHGDLSGASDVVKNRLHPLAQGVFNVALNRNYWGRPLTGKELPILTQAGRLAHEVTDVAAPAYVKAPVAAFAGEAGPEETLMKAVEAPVAYARPGGRDSVASPYGRGRKLQRNFQPSRRRR